MILPNEPSLPMEERVMTDSRFGVRRGVTRLALTLATLGGLSAAAAQTAPAPAAPAAERKDPRALDALGAMGAHLRKLKTFTLRADTTVDEVLLSGQKLQFGGTLDYRVALPDRLRLELRSDRQHRDLVFDGRTLTMYAPRMKLYARIDAPPTIAELVQTAERDFGLAFPLADLFLWGTARSGVEDIAEATHIGPAQIGGHRCEHYAFRQEGVDWQLWIRAGAAPLPCRIVITTTSEPERPQYSATFKWDSTAKPAAASFKFSPPADARRIQFARVDAAPAGK